MQFHMAIAAAAHNDLLSQLMSSLQGLLRQYIALANQATDHVESTIAEHQPIYDAIAAGDPDTAEQAMVVHLSRSKQWILGAGLSATAVDAGLDQD